VLSWNFFGKINILYLFRGSKTAGVVYSCIAIGFLFLGTLLSNDLVWELTDFFNYLMVLPNVMALIPLAGIVAKAAGVKKD
jgi:AGCS family alanine or glycine:cation symporter